MFVQYSMTGDGEIAPSLVIEQKDRRLPSFVQWIARAPDVECLISPSFAFKFALKICFVFNQCTLFRSAHLNQPFLIQVKFSKLYLALVAWIDSDLNSALI